MQDRAVRTREAIIAVAARHFDTDGYGHTSINTISATGKFAKGAMYYHFPSKEAMPNTSSRTGTAPSTKSSVKHWRPVRAARQGRS